MKWRLLLADGRELRGESSERSIITSSLCAEVVHYNRAAASIGSSAISIFAQEVY